MLIGKAEFTIDVLLRVPQIVELTRQRGHCVVPSTFNDGRIGGPERNDPIRGFRISGGVNAAGRTAGISFDLWEIGFDDIVDGLLILNDLWENQHIPGHNEIPAALINLHPRPIVSAPERQTPFDKDMDTTTTPALFRVGLALGHNINAQRRQEAIFIKSGINVDPDDAVVVEDKPQAVIHSGIDRNTPIITVDGDLTRPSFLSKWFSRLKMQLDLPSEVTFHSLRHTMATQMIQAGEDMRTVSERLGHASVEITLSIYAHKVPGRDQQASVRWMQRIGGAL